jgi:hypothetical protein
MVVSVERFQNKMNEAWRKSRKRQKSFTYIWLGAVADYPIGWVGWSLQVQPLRGSPCKNRPLEFRKITEFLQTFCVEEVIHKMNKKRWLWNCSPF